MSHLIVQYETLSTLAEPARVAVNKNNMSLDLTDSSLFCCCSIGVAPVLICAELAVEAMGGRYGVER